MDNFNVLCIFELNVISRERLRNYFNDPHLKENSPPSTFEKPDESKMQ